MAEKGSLIFDPDGADYLAVMAASHIADSESHVQATSAYDPAEGLEGQRLSGAVLAAAQEASSKCVGLGCPLLQYCTKSERVVPLDVKDPALLAAFS